MTGVQTCALPIFSLLPFQTTTSAAFVRTLATEATPAPTRHHATVEELHSQTAAEILAERDGDKSGSIRHFSELRVSPAPFRTSKERPGACSDADFLTEHDSDMSG